MADRVVVQTKSNADEGAWIWEGAAGAHDFKVRDRRWHGSAMACVFCRLQ